MKILLVSRRVGYKVLSSSQKQHRLLPHTEDDTLLPGTQGGRSHHHYPAWTPTPPPLPRTSSRAHYPTLPLQPESYPRNKTQAKCHLFLTLPPLYIFLPLWTTGPLQVESCPGDFHVPTKPSIEP